MLFRSYGSTEALFVTQGTQVARENENKVACVTQVCMCISRVVNAADSK